ncbi:MAG: hypothetical protein ABUL52_01140 [Solimonas sp.]
MVWLIPFVLGALLVCGGAYGLFLLRKVSSWPETPGRILERELTRDPQDKDETETVLYEYEVEAKPVGWDASSQHLQSIRRMNAGISLRSITSLQR